MIQVEVLIESCEDTVFVTTDHNLDETTERTVQDSF
jgi:hypothetical protein